MNKLREEADRLVSGLPNKEKNHCVLYYDYEHGHKIPIKVVGPYTKEEAYDIEDTYPGGYDYAEAVLFIKV